jgi:tetratricopeptide (TPR) repeat protein
MDSKNTPAAPAARPALRTARGLLYEPAIGPRLKVLLAFIFASVALLGATGAYLLAIRLLEWGHEQVYTNQFTLWMFLAHIFVGVLMLGPFLVFGITHLVTARHRKNRVAVRLGISLFIVSIVVGITGLALIQLEHLPQLLTGTAGRTVVYFLHVLVPVLAVVLYVLHRRAGPDIKWSWGIGWGAAVGAFVLVMMVMHSQDPRQWGKAGPPEGEKYFEPSKTRTADGQYIAASVLMMDSYCLKCHNDIYNDWFHSAHHFSSFNNPPYLFSVRETRKFGMERDGNIRASRWCAGCHDPVPFLSGAFNDVNFNDVDHPTAHAGITCTACHAITNVNSPIGNGDYTIEEPTHYPLAFSEDPFLQWVNNQLVKAKPDFHKRMFLKPFHRKAEFCSACHKVGIPMEVNHYKEFLRGQNHYDTYLLSGVSGHGARSFYYPPEAKTNCSECHMPLKPSQDFGRRDFDNSGIRKVHDHRFLGANTGLPHLLIHDPRFADQAEGFRKMIEAQRDFLRGTDPEGKDKKLRIDIFGLREGGTIDAKLIAPLRPELPHLRPGGTYLVEVVLRTLNLGHPFPQGTADSNEIWVDFQARSGDRVIGRSGALSGPDDSGKVDEWSHFVNVLMLDRNGNRINRRNPQDIFTPLYDHQIPPGAAQVIHYRLTVPPDVQAPVELTVRLRYRKFDFEYLSLVYGGEDKVPKLPVIDICEDRVTLPLEGLASALPEQTSPIQAAWQRWNDYGIGCYLEGGAGSKKGELRQAEEAFKKLLTMPEKEGHGHAYVNMARVYFDEGRLQEAVEALNQSQNMDPPAPWWTAAWFIGLVNAQNGHIEQAIENLEKILDPKNQPWDRKFDFTKDYVVINELANLLFKRSQQELELSEGDPFVWRAVEQYEATLRIEPEDVDAHYGLAQGYARLAWQEVPGGVPDKIVPTSEEEMKALAKRVGDASESGEARRDAAIRLIQALRAYGDQPSTPDRLKLPVLLAMIRSVRPTADPKEELSLRTLSLRLLSQMYRQTHLIYKPDDNARDRTVRLYREKHPAADHASQAIVIYPTNQSRR